MTEPIIVQGGATQNAVRVQELELENAHLKAQLAKVQKRLDFAIKDSCDDDARIRELARPFLKTEQIDGDSYGVPGIIGVVEALKAQLEQGRLSASEFLADWKLYGDDKEFSDAITSVFAQRDTAQAACAEMREILGRAATILKSSYVGQPIELLPNLARAVTNELARLKALVEKAKQ